MAHIREVDADTFDAPSSTPAAELDTVASECEEADGTSTLNEQARLQLKHHGLDGARLWMAYDAEGDPQGFALLRDTALDLAVRPEAREHGAGTALATAALAATDEVEAWSHAAHPAAQRIADRFGVPRARELLVMSRPTALPLTPADPVEGVRVRTYATGDDEPLLRLNRVAFADHPEQGRMAADDLRDRMAEPWFDPGGLFFAVDEQDTIIGFHWTKVHVDADPPYGEVYVVAVDPGAAGRGIGKLLTAAGLEHLSGTGVDEVILYVEGDNRPAIAVYEGQGFTRLRSEVQYAGRVS